MKVTLCLLFVMFILLVGGCAGTSQKDELYQAYVVCMNENKVPKMDERGVVALDKEQNPIMTYKKDACSEENAAYNVAAEKSERLSSRREMPGCGGDLILFCRGKCSARDMEMERCQCSCQSRGSVEGFMRGIYRPY